MANDKEKKGGHGFGLALVAAAAAAGYFLYGSKEGARNRKKVKGWMLKAKGEVLENIEKLKKIDEEDYNKIIDKVSDKYAKVKNLDSDEVYALMDDMRRHWKRIQKDIEPKAKKAAKKGKVVARKAINKAAKKVVKKTADKPKPKKKTAAKNLLKSN
ncbi:MAG: hypothetical protein KAS07_01120 [Candidatus Pacebacteria bacterium]|nr:hypothetical protein [Candidatus Paceibacterota bacterium]